MLPMLPSPAILSAENDAVPSNVDPICNATQADDVRET